MPNYQIDNRAHLQQARDEIDKALAMADSITALAPIESAIALLQTAHDITGDQSLRQIIRLIEQDKMHAKECFEFALKITDINDARALFRALTAQELRLGGYESSADDEIVMSYIVGGLFRYANKKDPSGELAEQIRTVYNQKIYDTP